VRARQWRWVAIIECSGAKKKRGHEFLLVCVTHECHALQREKRKFQAHLVQFPHYGPLDLARVRELAPLAF